MKRHEDRRVRGDLRPAALGLVLLGLTLLACPSSPPGAERATEHPPPGESPPPEQPPRTKGADEPDARAEEADAAPAKTRSAYQYEKQLPLEGNVRFKLLGRCTGCSGGTLEAEAEVRGSEIELVGEVVGCEQGCPTYRSATGTVVARRLKRKTYTVRSKLRVLEVEPLSLSAAKRTDWALFLMGDDCRAGIESLNGHERVTEELRTAFDGCYAKVSPDVRFETISSMLTWDNKEAYVPELIEALQETKTAYLAARVLGRVGDRRAVEPLIEALGRDDEALRWDAGRSLEMITEQELGQDQARWRAWYEAQGSR